MQYVSDYKSPIGEILLASDEEGIIGVWFLGQKYFANGLDDKAIKDDNNFIKEAKTWLDIYFKGLKPNFTPKIHFIGTPFQISVWKILEKIPYGKTVTYKDISNEIKTNTGITKMSCQAVGGAVGRNKISIIVPCHRVLGSNMSLTGYAGGIEKKIKLLELEGFKLFN